jgi:hypothetical protein
VNQVAAPVTMLTVVLLAVLKATAIEVDSEYHVLHLLASLQSSRIPTHQHK